MPRALWVLDTSFPGVRSSCKSPSDLQCFVLDSSASRFFPFLSSAGRGVQEGKERAFLFPEGRILEAKVPHRSVNPVAPPAPPVFHCSLYTCRQHGACEEVSSDSIALAPVLWREGTQFPQTSAGRELGWVSWAPAHVGLEQARETGFTLPV